MMMQSKGKRNEIKSNVIDLTETATLRDDDEIPFAPDSFEYYLFKYLDEEKLKFFLDKMNQNDNKYRFRSVENVVEEIFRISLVELFYKKKEADEYLILMPERKDQYIFDEKLKVFNLNKELKVLLRGSEPSYDCFLDLERSKEVLINFTFPHLGYKSVLEVNLYFSLLISYRANLLFIDYLKQLSTPPALKEIEVRNDEPETSNITLISFFDEPSKYPIILKLLSDKNHSYPNTNVWNTQSGFLIRVLKNLFLKKYFKVKPTNEEYKAIALNTFSCDMGIDTVKRSKSKATDTDLAFIPLSTTI
jgi:hypothetical protein